MAKLPQGFRAAGYYCGIKRDATRKDISLIVADQASVAAGVYTQNLVCAAPVLLDRQRTPSSTIRAVITNSGNANACTGEQGMLDTIKMAELTAVACGCSADDVLVMSTGIIGEHLPMQKVAKGIEAAAQQLAGDEAALKDAAAGILTTDTVDKLATRNLTVGGKPVVVTGIAKGSGMISPNMATMLALVMTDAKLTQDQAQGMLDAATLRSFNRISVDGHASTNDTLLLLASGASGAELDEDGLRLMGDAVTSVCEELARSIVNDGEGAQHLIEIHVQGSVSDGDAEVIGRAIANSPLVKTAVTGCDPNWGRIVSAAGYAGPKFDPSSVDLKINGVLIYESGVPLPFDAESLSQSMRDNRDVVVELSVGDGPGRCVFWTCDLTVDYVHINADYHT